MSEWFTPGTLLLMAAVATVLALFAARRLPGLWMAASLSAAVAALGASCWVMIGNEVWEWRAPVAVGGEFIHLRLDALSAFFLALVSFVGGAGTAYSRDYWSDARHPASAGPGRAWWNAMLAFMGLLLVSVNGLHFVIAWELFAVSGYFLVTQDRSHPEVRRAGWLYFAASHAGTLCLFGFFTLLAVRTGSWELGPMRDHPEVAPLFWLALMGFGLKAGVFPLHIWLPSAHANAPSHVSALLSGVALKMGVYGLVRFSGWLPMPAGAGWVVVALGIASAVLGVAFALGQHDLKRLLAYHSVENIGIILIGLGFGMLAAAHGHPAWGALALVGGLLHVWNHGLFKGLLFLGAGSVVHSTGTRTMSQLGGLWRGMPWTAGCFGLGAAAISGLPPLNGFVSEWLIYLGLFEAVSGHASITWAAAPAVMALAMTGALALACFVKVCGIVFLGLPRTRAARQAKECGRWMLWPMLALSAACAAIGLAPYLFWRMTLRVAAAWQPGLDQVGVSAPMGLLGACNIGFAGIALLSGLLVWRHARRNGIVRGPTWDCGYAAPSPRMQYTAGSFAGILTEWFGWILRTERREQLPRGIFPGASSHSQHTPETVLEKVVEPAGGVVMAISTTVRRLQHGRLQAYILYLLIGLAALSVMAALFSGGPK